MTGLASVKDNPAFENLIESTAGLFVEAGLSFLSMPQITFVCGGADEVVEASIADLLGYPKWIASLAERFRGHLPKRFSLRRQYIDWCIDNEPGIVCIRAETAITDLMGATRSRGRNDDLAQVETVIAGVCDCVLLFAESPGSLAELGMFCMNDSIAKKTFVVLLEQHQGGSFINRGPVARIARQGGFVPAVMGVDRFGVFRALSQRITADPPHNISLGAEGWGDFSLRQKFCLIDSIVDVCGVVATDDLHEILSRTVGRFDYWEVQLLVGMMLALGRATRTESGFLARRVSVGPERFIVGQDRRFRDMKARWNSKYREAGLSQFNEYLAVNR